MGCDAVVMRYSYASMRTEPLKAARITRLTVQLFWCVGTFKLTVLCSWDFHFTVRV